jgi:hypothetical protein
MTLPPWTQVLITQLTTLGLKILGAIAVWLLGRRLIALAVRFDSNRAIRDLSRAGFPAPEQFVYMGSGTSG